MWPGQGAYHSPPLAAAGIAIRVPTLAHRHFVARHLRPGRRFAVTFVASPSFDAEGKPDLLLGLLVFRDDVTHDELTGYGAAVREAAARVTAKAGGHNPWDGQRAPKCRVGLRPTSRPTRRTTGRTAS